MNKSIYQGTSTLWAMMLCLLMALTGCEKEYKLELPLAVTQNKLTLGAGGGSTHVLVYSTGKWKAELKNPEDEYWATIDGASGSDNGEFVFTYTVNPGIQRKATIVITSGNNTEEIEMVQGGYLTSVEVVMGLKKMTLPKWEQGMAIPFQTNMGLIMNVVKTKVEYATEEPAAEAEGDEKTVNWVLATDEEPGWLKNVNVEEDVVTFNVDENAGEAGRQARLTVFVKNTVSNATYSTSTIVTQDAVDGYFEFANADVPFEVEALEKTVQMDWTTNLDMYLDKANVTVSYTEPGQEWLQDFALTPQGLQCKVLESKYDGERHATVTVTCPKPDGEATATINVVQARPELETAYIELRERLPEAGSINLEKGFIMGYVISEPGNANLAMNVQPTWNTISYDENATTAYIESEDGNYGFRVKLDNANDASAFPRYAHVKISLAGLTLEREDAPARYTLSHITPANIIEIEQCEASALPVNETYIKDLTDDDIYTFVTFKDMELAIPFGSWGNQHEGFALKSDLVTGGNATQCRCDCTFRFFRDINGDKIPMLINAETPWRRPGARVPQGSGTVKGIVVATPLARQNVNGEQGTYQFRVLSKDDIKLNGSTSFSTRIAEWQWTGGASTIVKIAGSDSKVGANYGEGTMDTDAPYVGTKGRTALTTGFMGYTFASASPAQAFRYCGQWYNFKDNTGCSIWWDFSTKGLTGKNLTMTFTCGTGLQAQPCPVPEKWNFEYSLDGGQTYTSIVKNLVIYPSPVFAYTLGDCPAWNAEYVLDLPDSLLGKDNVRIRMKAASKKYLTASGFNKGTLAENTANSTETYVRFDAITIKYNK